MWCRLKNTELFIYLITALFLGFDVIELDDIRISTLNCDTFNAHIVAGTYNTCGVKRGFFFKWPAKEKNRSAFGTRFRNKSLCRPRVTTTRRGVFIHDRTIIINYNNIISYMANNRVRVLCIGGRSRKVCFAFVGGRISYTADRTPASLYTHKVSKIL